MATQPQTGLTYEDLRSFPDDNLRREIIDGELVRDAVAPSTRHQRVVMKLAHRAGLVLRARTEARSCPRPTDVYFSDTNVVEPDVLFVRARAPGERLEEPFVRSAPDLVVEVSSPEHPARSTLGRKRELYERFGVPEYWFVDLDADRVEVYRLEGDRYPAPTLLTPGEPLGVAAPAGPQPAWWPGSWFSRTAEPSPVNCQKGSVRSISAKTASASSGVRRRRSERGGPEPSGRAAAGPAPSTSGSTTRIGS